MLFTSKPLKIMEKLVFPRKNQISFTNKINYLSNFSLINMGYKSFLLNVLPLATTFTLHIFLLSVHYIEFFTSTVLRSFTISSRHLVFGLRLVSC